MSPGHTYLVNFINAQSAGIRSTILANRNISGRAGFAAGFAPIAVIGFSGLYRY
jgi:hypothetical protein